MRILATFRIALLALRRNKLRTALTMLGMIIGVAAVIAMVGIGNGAKAQVEAQVASLGQNVISIWAGSFGGGGVRNGWGSAPGLKVEDALAIQQQVPNIVGVSPEVRDRNQVLANGLNWNTMINGESPDYPIIRSWPISEGAMFTEADVRSIAKVAVIGQTVADELFPNQDPLGQTLRIRDIPFKIVGVLEAKGFNLFGQDQDDVVIIPYTSHMRRVSSRTSVSSILVAAASSDLIDSVQADITDLLRQRRKSQEQDFTVRNQVELAQTATETSKTMTVLLGAIAGVSLIVGGIGIMNIMLVSVTERTREIGIRMAIGAHGRDILLQFLIEAVTLSIIGGVVGILLGVGASKLLAAWKGWPTLIYTSSIVAAFAFSAAVGIFFGFYPARKASQLDPIDALRYE
ncbi:MAG TPA: ABC transporter permease [Dongiaceae bacterium]|nr:ABC transporter permease [Dongiaceae bacterium]